MPHITVQIFSGRTEEKKRELAEGIAREVTQILEVSPEHVSVSIHDVPREEWDQNVYAKFMEKPELLYRKPGYGPDPK